MVAKNGTTKGGSHKKTHLNSAYNSFIDEIRMSLDDEGEERWEVYEIITDELIRFGYKSEVDEYKYRLTNNENPNIVLFDILNRIDGTPITCLFTGNLKRYIDEDNMSRFHY